MVVAILLACGIALAADVPCGGGTCEGTIGSDTMTGSALEDQMYGIGANDTMYGGNGPDRLQGDGRTDTLKGGRGNDRIEAREGERDLVDCGRGAKDVAFFDKRIDGVRNCEIRNPPVG